MISKSYFRLLLSAIPIGWLCALSICSAEPKTIKEHLEVSIDAFSSSMITQKNLMISNLTGSSARITGIKASCSCAVVSFANVDVEPNSSFPLAVTMDASDRRASYTTELLVSWSNNLTTVVEIKVILVNLLTIDPPVFQIDDSLPASNKVLVSLENSTADRSTLTLSIQDEDGNDLSSKLFTLQQNGWNIDLASLKFPTDEDLRFLKVTVKRGKSETQSRYLLCKKRNDQTKASS